LYGFREMINEEHFFNIAIFVHDDNVFEKCSIVNAFVMNIVITKHNNSLEVDFR